jgi:hypothetical protein
MAKVKMADGRTIQVPDGSTPEQVNQAINSIHVAERAPFAEMAGEQAQNAINRIGKEETTSPLTRSDSAVERFGGNLGAAVGAPPRVSDFWRGPLEFIKHPIERTKDILKGMNEAHFQEGVKANQAFDEGRTSEGLAHTVYGGIPVVGPMLAHAGEQLTEGDVAGGLGTTAGVGMQALASPEGRTAALDAATLPVRGGKVLVRRVRDTGIAPQAAENFANRAMGTTAADLDAGVNPGRTMVRTGMPVAATKGSLLKKVGARRGELSKVLPPDHPMMNDLDVAGQNISHDIHQSRVTSPLHMSDWETGAAVGIPVGIMEGMAGGGGEGLTRGMEAAITGMLVKKGVESTPFRTAAAKVLGPWGKETIGPDVNPNVRPDAPQLRSQPTPMGPVPPPQRLQLGDGIKGTEHNASPGRTEVLQRPVPDTPTLYHGTSSEAIPSITHDGLEPRIPPNGTTDEPGVYLTSDPNFAQEYARDKGREGAVVSVDSAKYSPTNLIDDVWKIKGRVDPKDQSVRSNDLIRRVTEDDAPTTQSLRSAMDAQAADVAEIGKKRHFMLNKPGRGYTPKTLRLHDPDGTPVIEVPLDAKEVEGVYNDEPAPTPKLRRKAQPEGPPRLGTGPGAMLRKGAFLSGTDHVMPAGPMSGEGSVMYHGTSPKSIPSILKKGIDPKPNSATQRMRVSTGEERQPYVFLSHSPEGAEEFSRGAVLKVIPTHDIVKNLVLDEGEFIRHPGVIPPKNISVLKKRK